MSDEELAALVVDMVRDWLRHSSDGWERLSNFLEAMHIEIPNGQPWGAFEERVYALLDKWDTTGGE